MPPIHKLVLIAGCAVTAVSCSSNEPRQTATSTAEALDVTPIAQSDAVQNNEPVVVELFTSQGCSSCPPADALIGQIVDNPGLVVITRPVTYWDRLGWRDTLAREQNTTLQRAYATGPAGRGRPYTPQAVVNGRYGFTGSRRNELAQRIAEARRSPSGVHLAVARSEDGGRVVRIAGDISGTARLNLIALDSHESVAIGRGENGGRTVTYSNVVRDETSLGQWSGGNERITIPASSLHTAHADRYALVVRNGAAGAILAARYL